MAVGFVFAVKVLPIIIFIASVMAILYHLGIMQRVVALLARGAVAGHGHLGGRGAVDRRRRLPGDDRGAAAGPPLRGAMTESELFAVMAAGMATISGSVLLAYVAMGIDAGFLVTASFMSAPARGA